MNPSERIAARVAPEMPTLNAPGYRLDPALVITIVLAVARILLDIWARRQDAATYKRRLDRALDPKWYDVMGRLTRSWLSDAVRWHLPKATDRDIDAVIKGLADSPDRDVLALLDEAAS